MEWIPVKKKNESNFERTEEFYRTDFLSGYNIRLAEEDYWCADPDLRCDTFCETKSRNQFFEIKSFLYATDNQSLSEPHMAKIAPLYDLLYKKIQQFGNAHEDLTIDESIVPYYSRQSCKQFIRAKPIGLGYKLWILASTIGVPCCQKWFGIL